MDNMDMDMDMGMDMDMDMHMDSAVRDTRYVAKGLETACSHPMFLTQLRGWAETSLWTMPEDERICLTGAHTPGQWAATATMTALVRAAKKSPAETIFQAPVLGGPILVPMTDQRGRMVDWVDLMYLVQHMQAH